MKRCVYYCMTIALLQMLAFCGCEQCPDTDAIVKGTVVAVQCENVESNGWLFYRIKEIWKDESGGKFTLGTNDMIDTKYHFDKNENPGSGIILLHDGSISFECFPRGMNIHNGRIPALAGIPGWRFPSRQ